MYHNFKYHLSLLCILLFFSGCDYQLAHIEAPVDLIPKDTFTYVLHDLMVVESFYSSQPINIKNYYDKIPAIADTIFTKYKIDSSRFNHSMDYYAKNQEQLIAIYETIQDSLTINSVKLERKN